MALSAQTYIGDGINTDFVLDFTLGYISTDHIHVFLDEVEVDQNTLTFINAGGSVRLPSPPGVGVVVLVRRIVPNDKLIHDYQNGALVIEQNLDQSNLQAVMLQHESIDGFVSRGAGQDLDMSGFGIINLKDPVDPQDAMTFAAGQKAVADAQTSETNAAASAAAALVSENNAAASEAQAAAFAALFDNSLDPQGDWDASTTNFPATPTPVGGIAPAHLYRISVGGTMDNGTQVITVNVDDHIYWNPVDSEWAYFVINGVQVTSLTGQAILPSGTTAQRESAAIGHFRFNTDLGYYEGYNGTFWFPLAGVSVTSTNGQAQLPTGTTAQRDTGTNGDVRYNTDTNEFEGYKGGAWGSVGNHTGFAALKDRKVDVPGGTNVSGAWTKRELNEITFDPQSIVSLSNDEFTLQPGSYLIEWSSPFHTAGFFSTRLVNVTDAVVVEAGSSGYLGLVDPAVEDNGTSSHGKTFITITSAKTYRVEYNTTNVRTSFGLGVNGPAGSGDSIYTQVFIQKVK